MTTTKRLRVRYVDEGALAEETRTAAIACGAWRASARHGGTVCNTYGYSAETEAALCVSDTSGRVVTWGGKRIPANKATLSGVAGATLPACRPIFDHRYGSQREEKAWDDVKSAHRRAVTASTIGGRSLLALTTGDGSNGGATDVAGPARRTGEVSAMREAVSLLISRGLRGLDGRASVVSMDMHEAACRASAARLSALRARLAPRDVARACDLHDAAVAVSWVSTTARADYASAVRIASIAREEGITRESLISGTREHVSEWIARSEARAELDLAARVVATLGLGDAGAARAAIERFCKTGRV